MCKHGHGMSVQVRDVLKMVIVVLSRWWVFVNFKKICKFTNFHKFWNAELHIFLDLWLNAIQNVRFSVVLVVVYECGVCDTCTDSIDMTVPSQQDAASLPAMKLTLGSRSVARNRRGQKAVSRSSRVEKEVCTRLFLEHQYSSLSCPSRVVRPSRMQC